MSSLFGILGLGFFLGMRHATDPDHVIAVSTMVTRYRSTRSAAMIGAVWGLGHTLTILVVGGGIILLGWVIPVRVGLSLELSVGVMLIILGIVTLAGAYRRYLRRVPAPGGHPAQVHSHPHRHGDYVHTHPHGHRPDAHPHAPDENPVARLDRRLGGIGLYQLIRPLIVGVVHGLAGSAAVALLVLAAIGDPTWGVLYLVVFGAGTILGMMLITMVIALPFTQAAPRFARFGERLRIASGAISVGFGVFLMYQAGVVHGLFGASPQWTPR